MNCPAWRKPARPSGDVHSVRVQGAHFALPGAEVVQPAKNRCRVAVQRHWCGRKQPVRVCGFIRSRDDEEWPNLQYHFLPIAISYNGKSAVQRSFQAHVGSMRSESHGRIRLTSKDPRGTEHSVQLHGQREGLGRVPRRDSPNSRDHRPAASTDTGPKFPPARTCRAMKSSTISSSSTPNCLSPLRQLPHGRR